MKSVAFEPDADPPKFIYTEATDDREYTEVIECEWVTAKPDGDSSFHQVLVPRDPTKEPPRKVMEFVQERDISFHPESRITRLEDVQQ